MRIKKEKVLIKVKELDVQNIIAEIHVPKKMAEDYRECARTGYYKADCDSCSLRGVSFAGMGLCELDEMEQLLDGKAESVIAGNPE